MVVPYNAVFYKLQVYTIAVAFHMVIGYYYAIAFPHMYTVAGIAFAIVGTFAMYVFNRNVFAIAKVNAKKSIGKPAVIYGNAVAFVNPYAGIIFHTAAVAVTYGKAMQLYAAGCNYKHFVFHLPIQHGLVNANNGYRFIYLCVYTGVGALCNTYSIAGVCGG